MKKITLLFTALVLSVVMIAQTNLESSIQKTKKVDKHNIEYASQQKSAFEESSPGGSYQKSLREISATYWDIQFNFDLTAGGGGQAGIETDGNFIYVTRWQSDTIFRYKMDGVMQDTFVIAGVTGLRDLAFDGANFYGGAASNNIYKLDFTEGSEVLVSTITAPAAVEVRHIAYNSDSAAFWVGNWATDMFLVDMNGVVLDTLLATEHALTGLYGSAYDNTTAGGPYLWTISTNPRGLISRTKISDLTTTVMHNINDDVTPGEDNVGGGLFIHPEIITGTTTLGGLVQSEPDHAFGYDLASCDNMQFDIAIDTIYTPNNDGGCTLTATETISVRIINLGAASITSDFDIAYTLNGGTAVTETITNTAFLPGATIDHSFTTTQDLSATNTYDFSVYTLLTTDENNNNDTADFAVFSTSESMSVTIITDAYPTESSWYVVNTLTGETVQTSPAYTATNNTSTTDFCVPEAGCFKFYAVDSYGDGGITAIVSFDGTLVDTIHGNAYTFIDSLIFIGSGCPTEADLVVNGISEYKATPQELPSLVKVSIANNANVLNEDVEVYAAVLTETYKDTLNTPNPFGIGANGIFTYDTLYNSLTIGEKKLRFEADYADDLTPLNNIDTINVNITDSVLAKEWNDIPNGSIGVTTGNEGSFGYSFNIYGPDTLTSVSFFSVSAPINETATIEIYNFDAAPTTLILESEDYTFTQTDSAWYTIQIQNIPLDSGSYFVAVHQTNTNINIATTDSFYTDNTFWYNINGGAWTDATGSFDRTLFIRPNFGTVIDDIGVNAILSPSNDYGCTLSATDTVTLEIINYGLNTITGSFDVSYIQDGGTAVTETITLASDFNNLDTIQHTFAATIDLSAPGIYEFKAYTSLTDDGYAGNDTSLVSVTNGSETITIETITTTTPSSISWVIVNDATTDTIASSPMFSTNNDTVSTTICTSEEGCYRLLFTDANSLGGAVMYYNGTEEGSIIGGSYSGTSTISYVGDACPQEGDLVVSGDGLIEYPISPISLPYLIKVNVANNGNVINEDLKVFVDVLTETYTDTVLTPNPFNIGASQMFTYNALYTAASAGAKEIRFEGDYAADLNLLDNIDTVAITISDTVLTRDWNDEPTGSIGIGAGSTGAFGHPFTINGTDSLTSVSFLTTEAPNGEITSADVYEFNAGTVGALLGSSEDFTFTQSDSAWYTLVFMDGIALDSGTYFVAINEADASISIATSTNYYTDNTLWYKVGTGAWTDATGSFDHTLFLRLNFGEVLYTDINNTNVTNNSLSIYPNPATSFITIETNSVIENVKIVDIAGKVLIQKDNVTSSIDIKDLSEGVYFVKIQLDNKTIVRKLVKE